MECCSAQHLLFHEYNNAGVERVILEKSVMSRVSFDLGSGSRLSLPVLTIYEADG